MQTPVARLQHVQAPKDRDLFQKPLKRTNISLPFCRWMTRFEKFLGAYRIGRGLMRLIIFTSPESKICSGTSIGMDIRYDAGKPRLRFLGSFCRETVSDECLVHFLVCVGYKKASTSKPVCIFSKHHLWGQTLATAQLAMTKTSIVELWI